MPSAKYEIKRKCEECGSMFLAKTLDSHYCCKKCSDTAYNRRRAEATKRQQMDTIIALIPEGRDYISVAEAEAMFGVCKETIRRLIRSGKVSSINIGQRLTRVSKSELATKLPLRDEPIDKSNALPKLYSLEPEDCYSIGEIVKKYSIAETTVYSHIRKYSIPIRQIGRFVYAPKSEIDHLYKDVITL